MSKYINPYTDFGFKKLFREEANTDLLIDFLNTFLPWKHHIKTLKFRNTEQLGPSATDCKAIFDIFCEARSGEKFIVVMQNAKQHHFKDRALIYTLFPIREQGVRGDERQFEYQAVYFVRILGFDYGEQEERRKVQRDVMLKDQDPQYNIFDVVDRLYIQIFDRFEKGQYGDVFYDNLRFIFLQMPLFTKTESKLQTHRDKWLYFLKNLVSFDQVPSILREPIFEQAFETAEIARMNKEELDRYEASLKVYRDNYAVMETQREEGRAEGKDERSVEIERLN